MVVLWRLGKVKIKTYHAIAFVRVAFVILALSSSVPAVEANDELGGNSHSDESLISSKYPLIINIYGISYHPDRDTADRLDVDNEINPGLGLRYDLIDDRRGVTFTELGAYHDSGRNWAKFIALGYQFKLGVHWRLGGALGAMHSKTYNNSTAFITMIPLLTYDAGRIKLNAVYFPKFKNLNEVEAFGFYLSIPLGGTKP